MNEVLRDKAKDLADSISNAQTSFSERSEIHSVIKTLDEVNDSIQNIQALIQKTTTSPNTLLDQLNQILAAEEPVYLQYVSVFDNDMNLYTRLPYNRKLDEEHWELAETMQYEGDLIEHQKALNQDLSNDLIMEALAKSRDYDVPGTEQKQKLIASDVARLKQLHKQIDSTFGMKDDDGSMDTTTDGIDLLRKRLLSGREPLIKWKNRRHHFGRRSV